MYNSFPSSLNSGDFSAIKAKMDADYQNNQSIWNVFWTRAAMNVRLEAGDPTIMNTWGSNPATIGSSNYYFNRARPIGNSISGYQRRNRKSSVIVPLEMGDQKTADQYTKIIMNLYKRENVYELISEAFHQGAVISGMNLMQIYLDFSEDPINGDIKFKNLNYADFMIDPYFVEPDLSDASFIRVRTYMSKPAIAAIMPEEYYDEIMSLNANQQGSTVDGRFQYEAAARGYSMTPKLAYDEYWYRDYRKQRKLYDMETAESIDVSDRYDINLEEYLSQNPQIKLLEKYVPTVRLAICIQDKVFFDGPNPLGIDEYPFVAVLGYYSKSMPYMYNRIQSVMTSLISPQILFNRRLILNADFLESVLTTGWMFKTSAVLDVKHLFQTGAGRIIPLKDNAVPLQDVVPIPAPNIPPSAFQQLEEYDKELFNVVGISQENMGKVIEDDSSGYQSALRTAAGLTALQPIYDRLDMSQNQLANLALKIMQSSWTPAKVRKYLEGEEPAPQFYDKAFGRYHAVAELGFNTETQIQLEFAQLLKLKEIGVAITDADLIKKATLQGKDDLIQNMQKQAEQQQQIQQMQMQVQMQELEARAKLSEARAMADMGLYAERTSRVQENRALAIQKIHEANKDDEMATLNKIKALKELQDIDLTQLERILALAQSLKAQEQVTSKVSQEAEIEGPQSNPELQQRREPMPPQNEPMNPNALQGGPAQ